MKGERGRDLGKKKKTKRKKEKRNKKRKNLETGKKQRKEELCARVREEIAGEGDTLQ